MQGEGASATLASGWGGGEGALGMEMGGATGEGQRTGKGAQPRFDFVVIGSKERHKGCSAKASASAGIYTWPGLYMEHQEQPACMFGRCIQRSG